MKKTFEIGMYVPDAKSIEMKSVMIEYAKSKGLKGRFIRSLVYKDRGIVCFSENGIDFCAPTWSGKIIPITIAQFFEYCDNWQELQIAPGWIPVSIKPEKNCDVAVRVKAHGESVVWAGKYHEGKFYWYNDEGLELSYEHAIITHYQHLPKP